MHRIAGALASPWRTCWSAVSLPHLTRILLALIQLALISLSGLAPAKSAELLEDNGFYRVTIGGCIYRGTHGAARRGDRTAAGRAHRPRQAGQSAGHARRPCGEAKTNLRLAHIFGEIVPIPLWPGVVDIERELPPKSYHPAAHCPEVPDKRRD
jgi:hypothetical protein